MDYIEFALVVVVGAILVSLAYVIGWCRGITCKNEKYKKRKGYQSKACSLKTFLFSLKTVLLTT